MEKLGLTGWAELGIFAESGRHRRASRGCFLPSIRSAPRASVVRL